MISAFTKLAPAALRQAHAGVWVNTWMNKWRKDFACCLPVPGPRPDEHIAPHSRNFCRWPCGSVWLSLVPTTPSSSPPGRLWIPFFFFLSIILSLVTSLLFLEFLFHPSTPQLPTPGDERKSNGFTRLSRPLGAGPKTAPQFYLLLTLNHSGWPFPTLGDSDDLRSLVTSAVSLWPSPPLPQSHPQSLQFQLTSLKYLYPLLSL